MGPKRSLPVLFVGLVVGMSYGPLATPSAAAGLTQCTTTMTWPTTIPGNLIVPQGATCSLDGVTVTGSVDVERGASLFTDTDSVTHTVPTTIDRNLTSAGYEDNLKYLNVVGNVTIAGATGPFAAFKDGEVGGTAVFASNAATLAAGAAGTIFGGNVDLAGNTSAVFVGNSVARNLNCADNGSLLYSGNTFSPGSHVSGCT